jgi:hypothetical protein
VVKWSKLVGRDGEPYNVELITDIPSTGQHILKGGAFCREIMSLYQIADQYDIPQLRRDTMDICYSHLNSDLFIGTRPKQVFLPTPALITDAYESLPSSSSMITWITDVIANIFSVVLQQGNVVPDDWETCPKAFFISIYKKTASSGGSFKKMQLCNYHEHHEEKTTATENLHQAPQ